MSQQVKSKERVQEHGEVFTNEHEVNAMLDLVKPETERIDSRFLEPACGDGNFLAEVLRRKLAVVTSRYRKSLHEWERYCFVAVGSVYGVELLPDNVAACKERLYGIVEDEYEKVAKKDANPAFLDSIRLVLRRNILNGNALSLKAVDWDGNDTAEPIVFSEWSVVMGDKVKRRDFRLDEMLEGNVDADQTRSLFGADYSSAVDWEYDKETKSFIPKPMRESPLVSIYEISGAK
ncbi:SAM-dependent DNA methyltransferase [Atopobium sp. oral taxon 416]|uniref:SAM-dependent DNA methyltransferase n=1 Tax=Atopobium sp. oral taxon 416 TaxID=712157 RepID=UPI001BA9A716|nr:SAM-dependent DNA methyltransferase [Atopobium sp. oral taxon 416]QUC03871.1 SAM-dependent DNA methyltransferase [Atopobium sp. oral taxon 416]